jgi:hypothetical protein
MNETIITDNTAANALVTQGIVAASVLNVAWVLAAELGLPPLSLVPVCLALAGAALGNSARIKLPAWAGGVHGGLLIALCNDVAHRLSQVLDLLLQPFRDYRDEELLRLTRAGHPGPSRRSLGAVLLEDPLPGCLAKELSTCPDPSLLVVHHEAGLQSLLEALKKPQGRSDLQLLMGGYLARTVSLTAPKSETLKYIVQPTVTWILDTSPECLALVLESDDSLLEQIGGYLLCVAAPDGITQSTGQRPDMEEALSSWQAFIFDSLKLRASHAEYLLELSPEAAEEFKQLRRSCAVKNAAGRFAKAIPINAGKVALSGALFQNRPAQLSESMMAKAIDYTQQLATDTEKLAAGLENEPQGMRLEKKASKMLRFLVQFGRTTPSLLRRHYDEQKKETHAPVLNHLIATGRVRVYDDGTVEAVEEAAFASVNQVA